jgi:hypothetical protein
MELPRFGWKVIRFRGTPASRHRSPKAIEVYWHPRSERWITWRGRRARRAMAARPAARASPGPGGSRSGPRAAAARGRSRARLPERWALDTFPFKALKALQNGHRALFLKAQDLFDELYASLADRSSRKLVDRLARVPLLCIDEMGYLNLRPEQCNIFFKLMEERYRRRASIITTNLDYDDWLNFLGNKHMVTALLSRLRHQCTTIRIDGPSLREPQG